MDIYVEGLDAFSSGECVLVNKDSQGKALSQDKVLLVPMELISDLNNDGKINSVDSSLRYAANKSGASADEIENGTEYLFVNDTMSNGLWDKDDPDKPSGHTDDDDIQELKVTLSPNFGAAWFAHSAIDKLEFYKTKACSAGDKISFPWNLSNNNPMPEKIYVRTQVDVKAQVEGNLVLKFGKEDKSQTYCEVKLKFDVIKRLGDAKFFEAAHDYIMENNTRLFTFHSQINQGGEARITVMRESASEMKAVETYWRSNKLINIDEVASEYSGASVIINSNFTFDTQDVLRPGDTPAYHLTRRCHGRLISGGVYNADVSSDNEDRNVPAPGHLLKGSVYAGPSGKYIAMVSKGNFVMTEGRVPLDHSPPFQEAMGGFNTNYPQGNFNEMYVGRTQTALADKILFVMHSWGATSEHIAQACQASGVPSLPGGDEDDLMLIKGDAGTSIALAYKTANDELKVKLKGLKHEFPKLHYCINTYLAFYCDKPR